jgi:dUTP pyrophosphatase
VQALAYSSRSDHDLVPLPSPYATHVWFKLCSSTAKAPAKATPGSACWDLHADIPFQQYILEPGIRHSIPTGIKLQIPDHWVGLVFPRSGLAIRKQVHLANGVGVIDSDYRGELQVVLEMTGMASEGSSHNDDYLVVKPGDRIAQIMFLPLPPIDLVETDQPLDETARGEGGFGSTGIS